MDCDIEKADEFVTKFIIGNVENLELFQNKVKNYKSMLQEYVQKKEKTTPDYKIETLDNNVIVCKIYIKEHFICEKNDTTKKGAKNSAAEEAVKILGII